MYAVCGVSLYKKPLLFAKLLPFGTVNQNVPLLKLSFVIVALVKVLI